MFLFNHRLLLMGLSGPLELVWVILTALAGMFAFASATQGYLHKPNRWWDTLLLLTATWILFRPGSLSHLIPWGDVTWSLVGGSLFALTYVLQRFGNRLPIHSSP
jgi:TRAP-type uncharacterized transport system fused permease subunit